MRTPHLLARIAFTLLLILLIAPAPASLATNGSPEGAQEEATPEPTSPPTEAPTEVPTEAPTEPPTAVPTEVATELSTAIPTVEATPEATIEVTPLPELTAEATLETLFAPAPLVARVEPVTDASLMVARTFLVNNLADTADANGADNVCDVDLSTTGNQCTLRAALQEANEASDKDTINFGFAAGMTYAFVPLIPLPTIVYPVIINATTQPGYTWSTPRIMLDGQMAAAGPNGLRLAAGSDGSTIKGLVISDGWDYGIWIDSGSNLIQANFIGTSADGLSDFGNTDGVVLSNNDADNNTIGGTTAALRNVISGNTQYGVYILDGDSNKVQGNYIGTDRTGAVALGNVGPGVFIENSANSNTIGGTSASVRNVISGNGADGVRISSVVVAVLNLIQGNYIGLNAAGTADLGNTENGVSIIGSQANTIGGATAGARNVISGNDNHGINISGVGAAGTVIQANYIGTNAAGTAAIANTNRGINVEADANYTTIGGTTAALRNVISGNGTAGIAIFSPDNRVAGNYIGTNAAGTGALGNGTNGIFVNATYNVIGGTVTGAANRIAYNTNDGIAVAGGTPNRFLANLIYANGGIGIDLNNDGVTDNDPDDADTGANNLQNYPVLTTASGYRVAGSLNSVPSAFFRLQFFSSVTCDGLEYGEAERSLGTGYVMTNSGGDASFDLTLTLSTPAGQVVTATATDYSGNTSEFSQCFVAGLVAPVLVSPANNAVEASAGSHLFTWNKVAGATGYRIQIAYDPTFLGVITTADTPGNSGTSYSWLYAPSELESYYWRVQARGYGSQVGPWSATRRINIGL